MTLYLMTVYYYSYAPDIVTDRVTDTPCNTGLDTSNRPAVVQTLHQGNTPCVGKPVWFDLVNPTREEEFWVESCMGGIDIPTREDNYDFELSNCLYQVGDALHCKTAFITKSETLEPEIINISFVLYKNTVATVRYGSPTAFHIYIKDLLEGHHPLESHTVLVELLKTMTQRLSDTLEATAYRLDDANKRLFRPTILSAKERQNNVPDFEDMLRTLGVQGDVLSKCCESLMNLSRVFLFLPTTKAYPVGCDHTHTIKVLLKDVESLNTHATFLIGKVSFLLDATLGMVGLQQTYIMKMFSVMSIIFLPPMLVAGLYGMNFQNMPELTWHYGYGMALVLMALSGWIPYQFFKRKKWL